MELDTDKKGAFSVLMSIYAKEKPAYLKEALDSIREQSLQPDEIILIKDGIIPGELQAVINDFQRDGMNLQTYDFPENVQLGRALAKGVELCNNELIARMDTDDIAVSTRFFLQYEYMQSHPKVDVLGGWIEEFDDAGTFKQIKRMPERQREIIKYARYRNPVNHMSVMYRKSAVLETGNYHHFPMLEDYELWNRMLAKGKTFANLPCVLIHMRTNIAIYGRRGGWTYFKTYKRLRDEQYALGLLRRIEYVRAIILTFIMTLQPGWMRRLTYRKILRKNAHE